MKHLDDRRRCPHCLHDMNERPYLMSRNSTENVLPSPFIAWVIVFVLLLVIFANLHS